MVGELVQTIASDETIATGPVVVSAHVLQGRGHHARGRHTHAARPRPPSRRGTHPNSAGQVRSHRTRVPARPLRRRTRLGRVHGPVTWAYAGGTVKRVLIDVSGEPFADLAREAAAPTPAIRQPHQRSSTGPPSSSANDRPRRPSPIQTDRRLNVGCSETHSSPNAGRTRRRAESHDCVGTGRGLSSRVWRISGPRPVLRVCPASVTPRFSTGHSRAIASMAIRSRRCRPPRYPSVANPIALAVRSARPER
jgi:hypothetical protein